MFLNELAEPTLLVIYPGRFQPFHKGHHAVYEFLTGRFGRNNVYIATSNKVESPRSPFTFGEKAYFMQLTGVPADRIVQAAQPYNVTDVIAGGNLHIADPANTVAIFAVSQKDMDEDPRFKSWTKKDGSPAYFQPLKDIKQTESMDRHGYIMVVPTFQFDVAGSPMQSATELRAEYGSADEKKRQLIIQDLFGKYTREAEQIMNEKLAPAKPVEPEPLKKKVELKKVKLPRAKPQELAEADVDYGQQHAIPRKNITYRSPVYGQPDRPDPEKLKIINQVASTADRVLPDTRTTKVDGFRERAVEILNTVQDQGLRRVTADWIRAGLKKPEWQGVILGILMAYVARGTMAGATAAQLSPADTTIALEFMLPSIGNIIGFRWLSNQTWAKSIKAGVLSGLVGGAAAASTKAFFEVGGTGVVAPQGQSRDPRYSMSLTKDVRPGQIKKNLRAFDL